MKYKISLDNEMKAEVPGNLNKDKLGDIIKMYLFNEEYNWNHFSIEKVE